MLQCHKMLISKKTFVKIYVYIPIPSIILYVSRKPDKLLRQGAERKLTLIFSLVKKIGGLFTVDFPHVELEVDPSDMTNSS